MSVDVTALKDRAGVVPGLPVAADLADVWLGHALACLLEAGGAADADEATRERLDACRRAVVFAALALEARLNRVLRCCDPYERHAFADLAPAEKFRLAPRLLDELEFAAEDAALCALVVEVFKARDELVDADGASGGPPADVAPPLSAGRARAIVEESGRICCFLATLTDDVPVATAQQVWRAAGALARRADGFPGGDAPSLPRWEWDGDDEFPPDLIGS